MSIFDKISNVKFKSVLVPAPELGEGAEIKLQEMTGGQHAECIVRLREPEFRDSEKKLTAFMIMSCLVDDAGKREINTIEDAEKVLDGMPAGLIRRINSALAKLNEQPTEPEKKR